MIRKIEIENFKSVRKLELELGRVTVLIGENGAGKSNILEAIAFAGAAADNKLENEYFAARGLRMPDDDKWVLPAFPTDDPPTRVKYRIATDAVELPLSFQRFGIRIADTHRGRVWRSSLPVRDEDGERYRDFEDYFADLRYFLIYAPENRELRTFAEEGQIRPLGVRGEGLFRVLSTFLQNSGNQRLSHLKEKLQLIDWFEDFDYQRDAMPYERRLLIRDRHLGDDFNYFDQRSANEGFLFLLFYFCLFLSEATPPFFAIDNIDSSLNPRLCTQLVHELVKLAADNGKQAILTTHNPAVLDGLDLTDEEQRLYVVRRNIDGETVVDRIYPPKVPEGRRAVPLSEAFMRGYLGGLPNNF